VGSAVGVVVPSHHARFLRFALRSLLAQTFPLEIVVVDDGSPGGEVAALAEEFGIRTLRIERSMGAAAARNAGITSLSTPWILNFDHDNVASPRFVERLLHAASRAERVGLSYSRPLLFGDDRGPHRHVRRVPPRYLVHENSIDASSLFLREAWEEAGGFDPKASPLSDWDMWLGIVERGWSPVFVRRALWWYRTHGDSVLATASSDALERATAYIRTKHRAFAERVRHRKRNLARGGLLRAQWLVDRAWIELKARTTPVPPEAG
jgi:glycosyltransferase involved in cell wall biosynthesis